MTALYWFAMVVGVGMYLFSVFADVSGGTDVDGDAHLDVSADPHGADGFRLLSLRTATYFLFAFGVTGVVLTWLWQGSRAIMTTALSLAIGIVGGGLSAVAFGWLRKSESGELPGDQAWIGAIGEVVLPLAQGGTGKILAERRGRAHELLARPFDESAGHPEQWTSVMVLDMRDGVALVAPADLSLDGPDVPRLGASTET